MSKKFHDFDSNFAKSVRRTKIMRNNDETRTDENKKLENFFDV